MNKFGSKGLNLVRGCILTMLEGNIGTRKMAV